MQNSVRFPHLQRGSAVLADVALSVQNAFLDACVVQTFLAGDTVLAQNDPVNGMWLIAHGTVEVTSQNTAAQTILIRMHRRGETFGEIEALARTPAAATCRCVAAATLLFAPHDLLCDAMKTPIFMRNIFRSSYDRLVRNNTTKFVDQFSSVDRRLCDVLYRLSADRTDITKSQTDLAGLLGCARQTLNRELKALRDDAIIHVEKRRICILDRGALLARASAASLRPSEASP